MFLAVGSLNDVYKMLAAIALILYLARSGVHAYLGDDRAHAMHEHAAAMAMA